ncbi:MAG: hypothetical protein AMS23_05550 [Bacteroides sp. SM1_62]|nr:MAG: hypothetical protein AMS26_01505 [Bacteroides sp. SM23_62]KPL24605.1 MAG: hypothetical protein AMS23_05550 [Bacteroides sp. SM1_62]
MDKKKILTIIAIIISFPFLLLSQTTFERTYGGPYYDAGSSVLQTSDGGYIIIGTSRYYDSEINDMYLIRTDAYGDTIWTRVYGGDDDDSGTFIQETSDSGYIILGATRSFGAGSSDVYLIKIDATGDTLWTKTYGGTGIDYGSCVRQIEDQGYIIAGHTDSYGSGFYDIYLIKTDAFGDTLWTKVLGGSDFDGCRNIQPTSDKGYILVGDTKSFGAGDSDVYLIRTDESGDTLWTKTCGGENYDRGYSLVQTLDGYLIAGATESFGAGSRDVYIIRTNLSGDTLWTKTLGAVGYDMANFIQRTYDDGYIIVGETESYGALESDIFLIKIDSAGNVYWTQTIGGAEYDRGACVQQTSDYGFVITGSSKSYSAEGESDIYLVKTNAFGGLTGIDNDRNWTIGLKDFELHQNYPNPFNTSTTISYQVAKPSRIKLELFTIDGSLLMQVFEKHHQPGEYQWRWNPENLDGGLYFYRLRSSEGEITRKMILLK